MLTDRIEAYFRGPARGAAGNLSRSALRVLERLLTGTELRGTAEIGCGVSSILLAALSPRHVVFTPDDRALPTSAVRRLLACPLVPEGRVELVYGLSGETLSAHLFEAPLDAVLIAGAGNHPFPIRETWLLAPHLARGSALLVLDDVLIPHIRRLYDQLLAGPGFVLVGLAGATAFFRRTEAELPPAPDEAVIDVRLPEEALLADTPERALALAEAAALHGTSAPERAQLAANHGHAALAAGALETATAAFRRALAEQSDNADAYDGLARLAIAGGEPAKALPLRRWASLLDPNRIRFRLDLAHDLVTVGRIADAQRALLGVFALAPDHREALDLLAELMAALGQPDEAALCRSRAALDGPEGELPTYVAGTPVPFDSRGDGARYLGRGWFEAESWGRWSRGADSTLDFRLDSKDLVPGPGIVARLELTCAASHASANFRPMLTIAIDGQTVGEHPLVAVRQAGQPLPYVVVFDSRVLQLGRSTSIGLTCRSPIVPRLVGERADRRVLGLILARFCLSFERLEPAATAAPADRETTTGDGK
jgi:tetratricopeptide (TPR) repeat protein